MNQQKRCHTITADIDIRKAASDRILEAVINSDNTIVESEKISPLMQAPSTKGCSINNRNSTDHYAKSAVAIQKEKTSMIAWVEILIIVGINTSCGFMWNTFASVPTTSANWMNVSLTRINWLSNAAAIINTIFSFFAAWSYERLGLKISILLGAVLNTIGCWVRCIAIILPAERRYLAVMFGHCIASTGGPLIYNLGAKFVAIWFAPKDRGVANTLLSIQVLVALAPLLLPMLTPSSNDVPRMLIVIASMSTVFTIPAFFMPNKPKIPPSVSATVERTPILEGIKQLSKNIQFWWVTFIASISMGLAFSVSVLIIEAIAPFGYSEQQAGICASLIVFSGSIGGTLTGYLVGKTAQYFLILRLFSPLMVFSYATFVFLFRSDAFSIVIVACILNGFLSYSMVPVYLELATEITYPVSESVSSCILWTLSSITMVIFSIIIDALRAGGDASPPHNMSMSMIAVVIIIIIGNLPCLWLKGELKRAQVDNNFNNSNKPC